MIVRMTLKLRKLLKHRKANANHRSDGRVQTQAVVEWTRSFDIIRQGVM
jgi:hypothetical protein